MSKLWLEKADASERRRQGYRYNNAWTLSLKLRYFKIYFNTCSICSCQLGIFVSDTQEKKTSKTTQEVIK